MPKSRTFARGQHVRRQVTLDHDDDNIDFESHELPDDLPASAPSHKNIKNIATWIFEPGVKVNGVLATKFSKPIRITAEFTAQDSANAPRVNGKPVLYLFTAWKNGSEWKWEKLATVVHCADNACTFGTLTAEIRELRPGDPMGDGFD